MCSTLRRIRREFHDSWREQAISLPIGKSGLLAAWGYLASSPPQAYFSSRFILEIAEAFRDETFYHRTVSLPVMRKVAVVVILYCFCGIMLGQTPVPSVSPSRGVALFEVHDRNMIDALLMFGQQEHIGIGIDYIDAVAFQKHITIQLRGRTVGQIFDALTRPLGYRWSSDGKVVTVTHVGALVGKRNLLNTRMPHFSIGERSMQEADLALHIGLYFVLNPKSGGIAGDSPGGNRGFRVGPFDMKNATVREILNRIVSEHGSGAWVVQQPPWTMDKDLGRGVWRVVEYDRTDGDYSKGLEISGLGLHTP